MISERLRQKFEGEVRPKDSKALDEELAQAKAKGFHIPNIDYSKTVITMEQARSALTHLGVNSDPFFCEVMSTYRGFPLGSGVELYSLAEILSSSNDMYWESDYPGFHSCYLQLSSIEGEGSYFYEKSTGAIFDASWSEMDNLVGGRLAPRWRNYEAFLNWYYSENA